MPQGENLSGRVALVTGAASGIGAAVVRRLNAAGAKVASLDLDVCDAGDLPLRADIRSDAAVAEAVAHAARTLGPVDILVHAAAVADNGTLLEATAEQHLRLYDVNVAGAIRVLQAVVPAMRERGGGAVVLLSSINARFGTPGLGAYAMTKAAIESLARTAALEWAADGVRVNAIAPASIDTPMLRASFERQGDPDDARARNVERHPLGRLGGADDVAELATFLVSDRAAWITGAVYGIDGGAGVARR